MKRFRLSRRTLLRGVRATLALPVLEAMLNSNGTAFAQGAPLPRRFGLFFWGNGMIIPRWVPSYAQWQGKGGVQTTWQSEALAPLDSVKDYINLPTGFGMKNPNLRGHHSGVAGVLTGSEELQFSLPGVEYASKARSATIDQVAVSHIGTTTVIPSLQVRVSKLVTYGEGPLLTFLSHKGPDAPLTPEENPVALYNKLFGNFTQPGSGPPDPTPTVRGNILDAVSADARRLSSRLGAADRARLDQHLTGISELRRQVMALGGGTTNGCTKPSAPTLRNQEWGTEEKVEEVSNVMANLLAAAWACDMTRVFSFQFTGAGAHTQFSNLGLVQGAHEISHDPNQEPQRHEIAKFSVKQFAYLVDRLRATPEGAGNLLDSAVVLGTSDVSDGQFHGLYEFPFLIAGRGGGTLKYPGVHYHSANFENTTNILLTCLQAIGANVSSYGAGVAASSTPCRQIMV